MKSRLEEIDQYYRTNGRLIAHDQKWLIAELKRAQSALKVIRTWASVEGCLVPEQVTALCDKTLAGEPSPQPRERRICAATAK